MADPSVSSIAIYQLRVLLCGVSPQVWRRLLVISETSLAELQEILRTAFDWSDEHLHRFSIYGAAYGVPCLGGMFFREDAHGFRFPVFVCIAASVFGRNTTSRPTGSWTFGWSGFWPLVRSALFHQKTTSLDQGRIGAHAEPVRHAGVFSQELEVPSPGIRIVAIDS